MQAEAVLFADKKNNLSANKEFLLRKFKIDSKRKEYD